MLTRGRHANMSRPGRTGRIEWGIWSVRSKRWMHDPSVAPVDTRPARYPSRREAEEAADKLWRAYNPGERFKVLPF